MRVICLPGDGIGPIVLAEAVRVLRAVGFDGSLEQHPFGHGAWLRTGGALPPETEAAIREAGVALLGAATTPEVGCPSPILALRRALDLDLLVRPAEGPGWAVVLVAHAWEGLYAEPEQEGPPVVACRVLTEAGVDRLVAEAFARATRRVTLVDKPTVLRHSARLFRDRAARHATLPWDLVNADAFVAGFLRDPGAYDVVAATSFVGDVLSDLFAAVAGGVGLAPSASLAPAVAVFEPVHGSAPRRAAEDPARVSPIGAILAAAMLLDHVGEGDRAARVRHAVAHVRRHGPRTPDQGGTATTAEVGAAIAAATA